MTTLPDRGWEYCFQIFPGKWVTLSGSSYVKLLIYPRPIVWFKQTPPEFLQTQDRLRRLERRSRGPMDFNFVLSVLCVATWSSFSIMFSLLVIKTCHHMMAYDWLYRRCDHFDSHMELSWNGASPRSSSFSWVFFNINHPAWGQPTMF